MPGDQHVVDAGSSGALGAVAVLRAIRSVIQGTSAALGALCTGPEVEEEEEGWLAAWLASGMFDGGLQAVPCSAMGPEGAADLRAAREFVAAAAAQDGQAGEQMAKAREEALHARLDTSRQEVGARRLANTSCGQLLHFLPKGLANAAKLAARSCGLDGAHVPAELPPSGGAGALGGVGGAASGAGAGHGGAGPSVGASGLDPTDPAISTVASLSFLVQGMADQTDPASARKIQDAARPTCIPDKGSTEKCNAFIASMFKEKAGKASSPSGPNGGRGLGIDPSTWPGSSKTGAQLARWARLALIKRNRPKGKPRGIEVAFLAAFLRHSGMWENVSAQVSRARVQAGEAGLASLKLQDAMPPPAEEGPIHDAMTVLTKFLGSIKPKEKDDAAGAAQGGAQGAAAAGGTAAAPQAAAGNPPPPPTPPAPVPAGTGAATGAAAAGGDGDAGGDADGDADGAADGAATGAGEGGAQKPARGAALRSRKQMSTVHPTSPLDRERNARGALLLWAFCAAGASPLKHEGLARASRASAAAHAHSDAPSKTFDLEFAYTTSIKKDLSGVVSLAKGDAGASDRRASGSMRGEEEHSRKMCFAFADRHPDTRAEGLGPVLTALRILMGETHTLDLGALAGALHRRRQRAADRVLGLRGIEALLAGVSGCPTFSFLGAVPVDGAASQLLSRDVLWAVPDCFRTRSAYDRRVGVPTESGAGNPLFPGKRQALHLEAGLKGAPADLVRQVRLHGGRLLGRLVQLTVEVGKQGRVNVPLLLAAGSCIALQWRPTRDDCRLLAAIDAEPALRSISNL